MLRFCARTLLHDNLKQTIKLYKHHKYKYSELTAFGTQLNPTSSHAFSKNEKFHTNCQLNARIFKDSENTYAYNVLQNIRITNPEDFIVKSANTTISTLQDFNNFLDQDWRSKLGSEIVEGFKSTLKYCIENNINVSDKRFDKLVDGLMDHVEDLTDSEISELLNCLEKYPLCESYSDHNFHDIWSALDDVCCWKMHNWSNERRFLIAEQWYQLNLGKVGKYINEFVQKLADKPHRLSKAELIHAFFYINICRNRMVDFNYEHALEKHIHELNADEMAVIAMGFFKSQSRVKLKLLLGPIIEQATKESHTIHEITLSAILKVLRHSSHVLLIDQLMDLLDHLVPEIDRLSNLCCIHIALLGTTLQFFHEKSLETVTKKVLRHITNRQEIRLKDLERLLVALTMFNYKPKTDPDIFEAIFQELHKIERQVEIIKYPRCLPSSLGLLSMQNIYSYELMDEILDMDAVVERYGKSPKMVQRDVFALDVCIDVECPDYKGKRLDKTFRQKAAKWTLEYTPTWEQHKKITSADKFILDLIEIVKKITNGHFYPEHVLPNFVKADIIVCKDKDGKFVKPSGFENYTLGDVMRPTDQDLKWFAIVHVNWNNTMRNNPTQPLGLINMKCRQLRLIGYEPILVLASEFLPLQEKGRIDYIQKKIR